MKKGSFLDTFGLFIVVFVAGLIIVSMAIAFQNTMPAIRSATDSIDILNNAQKTESKEIVGKFENGYYVYFDLGFALALYGGWFALMLVAWLLGNNPIFFWIFLIVGGFAGIAAFGIWVAGVQIIEGAFSISMVNFPMMNFIIQHFFIHYVVIFITVGFLLYLKSTDGVGESVI